MEKISLAVAEYLINIQVEIELLLSNLKLQKLMYYCQAYHLAITDKPLFKDDIQAWRYGPVVPSIYEKYKEYKNNIISPSEIRRKDRTNNNLLNSLAVGIISQVLNGYGRLNAIRLMQMTHAEDPWKNAYNEGECSVIRKEVMQKYYKKFLVYDNNE